MGLFMWRPILKNFMQDCSLMLWDHKFINASNFKLYVCGASKPLNVLENEFIHAKADPRVVRLF